MARKYRGCTKKIFKYENWTSRRWAYFKIITYSVLQGGYKRTPKAALEREITILLLNLYIKATALQKAVKVINYPVERDIKTAVNNIWEAAQELVIQKVKKRGRLKRLYYLLRQPTQQKILYKKVKKITLKKRTKLTKITNTNTSKFRTPRVLYTAL